MSSFIGFSRSNFNSYDDPIVIDNSSDEEELLSENGMSDEAPSKTMDKSFSFNIVSSSVNKVVFSTESSKEDEAGAATTITIMPKKPKLKSKCDWNAYTEMEKMKTNNGIKNHNGNAPSSSSMSSSPLMEENSLSPSPNAKDSSSSCLVYHSCSCNDKSLLRRIGSKFEDTETQEKFKIVDVVKARDNRCAEETLYFKYYDIEMFKECPKKAYSFEYTPCYELLYELSWVKWINVEEDHSAKKGNEIMDKTSKHSNKKRKVNSKVKNESSSKSSRSGKKNKRDEEYCLIEMPPTEVERAQMEHPENESSYPFDYELRRMNYASDVASCISGPSGAETLARSLLLSTTNANDVLEDIFYDPLISRIDAQVELIDKSSQNQKRGRLDRFNQRALLFHLYQWMNPIGRTGNLDLSKLTLPLIQEVIMKVPRSLDELATHCGSEYGWDLIVENREILTEMCNVVEKFCQSRIIPFNGIKRKLRDYYTNVYRDNEKDGRNDAFSKQIDEQCVLDDLIALRPRIPLSNHAFKMAMFLTYKRLGGTREAFEGKGGGTRGATVFDEKDTSIRFQYGGMSENFIQEMCERSCVGKDDIFVDIGSGIGQVVIQVAATMGCKSWGYEVVEQRHSHAMVLKKTFLQVLRDGKVLGVDYLDNLIQLHCAKFQEKREDIAAASVIFFNNFAHYFTQLMDTFVENVGFMKVGTRVITLSSVHELAKRCCHYNAASMIEACNWKQNKLDVNYYTKVSNGWTCDGPSGCGYDRNNWDAEECERCAKRKHAKRNKRGRDVVDR